MERLRQLLKLKHVSLRTLSRYTEIPLASLSDLMNDLRTPKAGELEKIAQALGVEVKDLEGQQ